MGTVHEYQLQFEDLKSLMLNRNPYMNEEYFVSSFINKLNNDLRSMVKMMRPRSVQEAAEDALLQELTVEALMKKQRSQMIGVNPGMALSGGRIQNKENFRGGIRVRYMANSVPNMSLP